jgi:hypothetical protein
MHLIISIIFGGLLLFLLARAILETVLGLGQLLFGLLLLAVACLCKVIAWAIRANESLWRMAFG